MSTPKKIIQYKFTTSDGKIINGRTSLLKHTGFIPAHTLTNILMKEKPYGSFTWKNETITYEPVYSATHTLIDLGLKSTQDLEIERSLRSINGKRAQPVVKIQRASRPEVIKPVPEPTYQIYQLHDRLTTIPDYTRDIIQQFLYIREYCRQNDLPLWRPVDIADAIISGDITINPVKK